MLAPTRSRLDVWIPALLMMAGSVVFIGGGSRHPHVNANSGMGTMGSDEFYRHFAGMIQSMPNWELFHTLILIGPLLWALGATGATKALAPRATVVGDVARSALLMGAALWALAFVLDGYVAPRYARVLVAAGPGSDAGAIATFGANAFTMARLGMISVVLMGAAVAGFGAALLFDTKRLSFRAGVGATGLLVGAWPALAAMRGQFYPGPFTSVYWTATAVAFGLWFLFFGVAILRRQGALAPLYEASGSSMRSSGLTVNAP
jgi:hypothetical protein